MSNSRVRHPIPPMISIQTSFPTWLYWWSCATLYSQTKYSPPTLWKTDSKVAFHNPISWCPQLCPVLAPRTWAWRVIFFYVWAYSSGHEMSLRTSLGHQRSISCPWFYLYIKCHINIIFDHSSCCFLCSLKKSRHRKLNRLPPQK